MQSLLLLYVRATKIHGITIAMSESRPKIKSTFATGDAANKHLPNMNKTLNSTSNLERKRNIKNVCSWPGSVSLRPA